MIQGARCLAVIMLPCWCDIEQLLNFFTVAHMSYSRQDRAIIQKKLSCTGRMPQAALEALFCTQKIS